MLRGPGEVLAHPSLAGGTRGLSPDHPIPTAGDIGDTVIDAFEHGEGKPLAPPSASADILGGNVTVDSGASSSSISW